MTQADFGIALLLFLITAGFTLFVRFGPYRREGKIVQTYKLYKVRDDFVYLVAQGKLQEYDRLFQSFYRASNFFIQHTNHITLKSLVAAFRAARERKLDPAEEEHWKQIHEELQHQDQAVITVVQEFYQALLDILIENSLLLRIGSRHTWAHDALRWFAGITEHFRYAPPQRQAYTYYRDYARARAEAV